MTFPGLHINKKILQEMDSWYKSKFVDLNNKTTKHVDNIRNVREVIVTAKKDVSNNDHS